MDRLLATLKILGVATVAVFAPIQGVILTALTLVAVDFVTGVWAAWKRSEKLTSGALRRTLTKIAVYEVAIVVAFLIETYLTGTLFPGTRLVGAMVGLVEGKSIVENLDSINGSSLFRDLLTKLNKKGDPS